MTGYVSWKVVERIGRRIILNSRRLILRGTAFRQCISGLRLGNGPGLLSNGLNMCDHGVEHTIWSCGMAGCVWQRRD